MAFLKWIGRRLNEIVDGLMVGLGVIVAMVLCDWIGLIDLAAWSQLLADIDKMLPYDE